MAERGHHRVNMQLVHGRECRRYAENAAAIMKATVSRASDPGRPGQRLVAEGRVALGSRRRKQLVRSHLLSREHGRSHDAYSIVRRVRATLG